MGNAGVDQTPVNLVVAMDFSVATALGRARSQFDAFAGNMSGVQ